MYKRKSQSEIKFIAIDWGASNFRAYAIDNNGQVKQRTKAHHGTSRIKDANYSGALKRLLGKWFNKYPTTPLMMCGMVGAEDGWQEVEPVEMAAGIYDLAEFTEKVANHRYERDIFIVPGLKKYNSETKGFCSMYGDEVQVFGALAELPKSAEQIVCLPGSQSKWVQVKDGVATDFTTFLTGELFNVLVRSSNLTPYIDGCTYNAESFAKGLQQAQAHDSLLANLYSVYAHGHAKSITNYALSSYLSALLIASEIQAIKKMLPKIKDVVIVGAPWLIESYQQAAKLYDLNVIGVKSDVATVNGLNLVYDAMQSMPQSNYSKTNYNY